MPKLHRNNFDAIALDFDGTLVNSDAAHTEARLLAYEELAYEFNEPRLENIDPAIHIEAHHHGSNPFAINNWILAKAGVSMGGINLVEEIVKRKKANYSKLAAKGLEPVLGAIGFMQLATAQWGNKVMIVTTAHREQEVVPFLEKYDLRKQFPNRRLVTTETVKKLKPHPDAYVEALGRLGLKRHTERLLVVEDTPHGIEAANRAGATTVGIHTPERGDILREQTGVTRPDYIVDDFGHLATALNL